MSYPGGGHRTYGATTQTLIKIITMMEAMVTTKAATAIIKVITSRILATIKTDMVEVDTIIMEDLHRDLLRTST